MVISSLPLVLLDPDQAPEALQLVALDEDQVMVMVVLSCTSLADAEILIVGVGVVVPPPPALPPPPPPPHETRRTERDSRINFFTLENTPLHYH